MCSVRSHVIQVHHRPANAEAYCTDAAQYSSRVLNTPTTVSQSIAAPAVPTFGAAKNIRTRLDSLDHTKMQMFKAFSVGM